MDRVDELLADYEPLAARILDTLKSTSDDIFDQPFTLSRKGAVVLSTTHYAAYRNLFLDHMIHHRAQLGVYLRLLNIPVPATFGPPADET